MICVSWIRNADKKYINYSKSTNLKTKLGIYKFNIIAITKNRISLSISNGYHFDTALLLSVFLGMFGVDRFYLGYPAIGLMKFCTLGFMFVGQLVDIVLIATQTVGPADGSSYVIPYYGPGISVIRSDNWTFRRPQADW